MERHDWSKLPGNGPVSKVPAAIIALQTAQSKSEAENAYWRIDNVVIVQGTVYASAVVATRCLIESLLNATTIARQFILELLVQISSANTDANESNAISYGNILDACKSEVMQGCAVFFHLLEHGSMEERMWCIDLVGMCALDNKMVVQRAIWYFNRLLKEDLSAEMKALLENWLVELRRP